MNAVKQTPTNAKQESTFEQGNARTTVSNVGDIGVNSRAQSPDSLESQDLPRRRIHFIGNYRSGAEVMTCNMNLSRHTRNCIREALSHMDEPTVNEFYHTFKFRSPLGQDNVIQVLPGDQVTYVQLKGTKNWVPVVEVERSEKALTKMLSFSVKKGSNDKWYIKNCHLGEKVVPSPSDRQLRGKPGLFLEAIKFWEAHAIDKASLIRRDAIVPGSETPICPWRGK